jgi:hypothetical protein
MSGFKPATPSFSTKQSEKTGHLRPVLKETQPCYD